LDEEGVPGTVRARRAAHSSDIHYAKYRLDDGLNAQMEALLEATTTLKGFRATVVGAMATPSDNINGRAGFMLSGGTVVEADSVRCDSFVQAFEKSIATVFLDDQCASFDTVEDAQNACAAHLECSDGERSRRAAHQSLRVVAGASNNLEEFCCASDARRAAHEVKCSTFESNGRRAAHGANAQRDCFCAVQFSVADFDAKAVRAAASGAGAEDDNDVTEPLDENTVRKAAHAAFWVLFVLLSIPLVYFAIKLTDNQITSSNLISGGKNAFENPTYEAPGQEQNSVAMQSVSELRVQGGHNEGVEL
jgi:hypothetical protein